MSDADEAVLALMNSLAEHIPSHRFSVEVRFWGPKRLFKRVVLVTDPTAFGDEGGAAIPEDERTDHAVTDDDFREAMDECVFPFGLIEINETRARYSVTAGETPLERLAARFISTLTTHDELAGGLHRLVSLVPENLLYYKGKSGVDAVILTLTRGLPIPPQPKGGRRRKEPEIETW